MEGDPARLIRSAIPLREALIPVDPGSTTIVASRIHAKGAQQLAGEREPVLPFDVASVPTPSGFVPYLPKAGVFAHGEAEVVANNISIEIRGRGKVKAFDGGGSCFLMTGGAQAAFVKGTWFSTPRPAVKFSAPNRTSYMQRVLFEKYWLRRWF